MQKIRLLTLTAVLGLLISGNVAGAGTYFRGHHGHNNIHDRHHGHSVLHYAYPILNHLLYRSFSRHHRRPGHNIHRHRGHGFNSGHNRCRRVSKHDYHHGREALIGGTLCYDSYGNPYIVRGSRYIIRYY